MHRGFTPGGISPHPSLSVQLHLKYHHQCFRLRSEIILHPSTRSSASWGERLLEGLRAKPSSRHWTGTRLIHQSQDLKYWGFDKLSGLREQKIISTHSHQCIDFSRINFEQNLATRNLWDSATRQHKSAHELNSIIEGPLLNEQKKCQSSSKAERLAQLTRLKYQSLVVLFRNLLGIDSSHGSSSALENVEQIFNVFLW